MKILPFLWRISPCNCTWISPSKWDNLCPIRWRRFHVETTQNKWHAYPRRFQCGIHALFILKSGNGAFVLIYSDFLQKFLQLKIPSIYLNGLLSAANTRFSANQEPTWLLLAVHCNPKISTSGISGGALSWLYRSQNPGRETDKPLFTLQGSSW